MNSSSVMSTQRINAGIVLRDFTAAAAVRPILLISMALLQMLMISDVKCRKSGSSVQL